MKSFQRSSSNFKFTTCSSDDENENVELEKIKSESVEEATQES